MRGLRRILLWTVVGLALLASVGWWLARPTSSDPFFRLPATATPAPGELLRSEPFARGVPAGAVAWRILYATQNADGSAAFASAIVMRSRAPAPQPRPVIDWTHGTTGVTAGCGPSQLSEPFANVPALESALSRGWVIVATDYAGQGTSGRNPYLIGAGEAYSALDAVRAARHVPTLELGNRVVVWGHSQGGNAALWTGASAPQYAPDVDIVGVAAVAPASDLRKLIVPIQHTPVGRIMSSYILRAYADNYPDVRFGDYAAGWRGLLARDMAGRCLAGRAALFSAAEALAAGGSVFSQSPVTGALGARLAENTPTRAIAAPVMIAQGRSDELVLPDMQADFVRDRCAAGQVIEFHQYAGEDHLSIVAPASPLNARLLAWTEQRLSGAPAAAKCVQEDH